MALIKTNGGLLTVTINSIAYQAELTNLLVDKEEADGDTATFAEVNAGGAFNWFMEVTGYQDFQDDSLWSVLWDNPGTTYTYILAPVGGTGAADAPVFTGSLKTDAGPSFGGEAGSNWTFDYRFELTARPTKDNTP